MPGALCDGPISRRLPSRTRTWLLWSKSSTPMVGGAQNVRARARTHTHTHTHTLARACMPAGRHALTKACQRRLGLYRAGRIPWLLTTRTRAGCQVPGVDLAQRRPAPRVRRQRNRPVGADRMRVQHGCSGDVCGLPGSLAPLYICVRGRGWHGRTLTWVINEPCNR